jgi:hypothetical protein
MNEILKVLDTKEKQHPSADVRELSCSVAAAYVAGDYENFLTESRKLNRVYKALAGGSMGIPADREEQERFEVGSDHK